MGPAFVEGKFHGIGPATSAKMNALGIFTGLDMRNQTLEFINANFGKTGAYYYWISRGVDERPVRANRIRKSVGAESTFSTDLRELDALVAELEPLIEKVWRWTRSNAAATAGATEVMAGRGRGTSMLTKASWTKKSRFSSPRSISGTRSRACRP
jgi:DNA polymerase IV